MGLLNGAPMQGLAQDVCEALVEGEHMFGPNVASLHNLCQYSSLGLHRGSCRSRTSAALLTTMAKEELSSIAGPGGEKARIWRSVQATGIPQILVPIVLWSGLDDVVKSIPVPIIKTGSIK